MTTASFFVSQWNWNPIPWIAGLAPLAFHGYFFPHSPRRICIAIGTLLLLLSLVSPLHRLADSYLFSAHMLEHLFAVLIVPPLFLLSLPPSTVTQPSRVPRSPLPGWLLGISAMWIWHLPVLCNLAAQYPVAHYFQYLSLLLMGLAFWRPILGPSGHLSPLAGIVYLFTACTACTVLGIILTFAPPGICSAYLHPTDELGILTMIREEWGVTPKLDQQIGGLLMWVPACLVYLIGIMGLLVRLFYPGKVA